MKRTIITCLLLAGGLLTTARADDAKPEAQAKISKADAEKAALAKVPNGAVKESELEKEDGKLIWSVDVTLPDTKDIKEVAVNAVTGEVDSVETETAADQAKEAAEDAAKEKKHKKEKGEEKD